MSDSGARAGADDEKTVDFARGCARIGWHVSCFLKSGRVSAEAGHIQ
jgi:hypothetical protein